MMVPYSPYLWGPWAFDWPNQQERSLFTWLSYQLYRVIPSSTVLTLQPLSVPSASWHPSSTTICISKELISSPSWSLRMTKKVTSLGFSDLGLGRTCMNLSSQQRFVVFHTCQTSKASTFKDSYQKPISTLPILTPKNKNSWILLIHLSISKDRHLNTEILEVPQFLLRIRMILKDTTHKFLRLLGIQYGWNWRHFSTQIERCNLNKEAKTASISEFAAESGKSLATSWWIYDLSGFVSRIFWTSSNFQWFTRLFFSILNLYTPEN